MIEYKDIKYKKPFLIVLFVISQINKFPDPVVTSKKTNSEFFSLICRSGFF